MNYVQWNLNTENSIDVIDPMRNLYITGDKGEIVEKSTNLDTFFEALLEAAQSIKIGKSIIVDPVVEPNELHFNYYNDALEITYGQQQTTILDMEQFLNEIQEAVKKLLETLDRQSAIAKLPKRRLVKLREYLAVKA